MIMVTGDIHGNVDIGKLSGTKNKEFKEMTRGCTKNDLLIICGDFGLVWDNGKEDLWWRAWLDEKPFTTLFIDGNHENFDLLYQFEELSYHGGRAHKISDSIYHLMRGQAYEFEGKRFFTMGGAESHDKWRRKLGESLWEQELPSLAEYDEALATLERINYTADYILTHSAPDYALPEIMERKQSDHFNNDLTHFLGRIDKKLSYRQWFCGHYHIDMCTKINPKLRVLYNDIVVLE